MNVADFNASGKSVFSNCDSIQAIQQALHDMADELTKTIHLAAEKGESFDFVERRVRDTIFEMGMHATDLFIALQGDGDLGERVRTEDGQTLQRSQEPSRMTFRSIFGVHRLEQCTYASGPKKAIALRPVSARMSLPKLQFHGFPQTFLAVHEHDQHLASTSAERDLTHDPDHRDVNPTIHRRHPTVAGVLLRLFKRRHLGRVLLDQRHTLAGGGGNEQFLLTVARRRRQLAEELTRGLAHFGIDVLGGIDRESAAKDLAQIVHRLFVGRVDGQHLRELLQQVGPPPFRPVPAAASIRRGGAEATGSLRLI